MNPYEQKQEERRERLLQRATVLKGASDRLATAALQDASLIPMGQPILVGHHSEGRDRRFRHSIARRLGKAKQLRDKADALARRAEGVGLNGISSDDPAAVEKLQAKLATMEASQERMKAANRAVRSKNPLEALRALGIEGDAAKSLLEPDFMGRVGFPAYALSNANAEMRRLRLRIAELEQRRRDLSPREMKAGSVTVVMDPAENRVLITFPGKPCEADRTALKRSAFKWSPTRGAWVRQLTTAAEHAAQDLLQVLAAAKEDPNG